MRSFVVLSVVLAVAIALSDDSVEDFKKEKAELTKNCPTNMQHQECTPLCSQDCNRLGQINACFSLRCGAPGCTCKEGHVLVDGSDHSKGCIHRHTCLDNRKKAQPAH